LQEPPDAVAAVTPEGNELHWNRPAAHDPVKTPFSPAGGSPGKTFRTILVIGDIPANLDFAHSALQSSGYNVVRAGSVNRAVALIEEIQPDAVLSDLHMRPLDGLDFLEIARRTPALRHVPIVIISSTCTLERERCSCLEHGAARFIRRPIQPEALLDEIAEALDGNKKGRL
jgi:two-component system cell cycle response regulator